MFPEYSELISQLKGKDYDFTRLYEKHQELDQKIQNLALHLKPGGEREIDALKKEKLQLKDQLLQILQKAKLN